MSETHLLPQWLRGLVARRLARPADRASRSSRRRRACIYKVDRIGDFVLATGAIRQVVEHFGATECRLVVSEVAAPFAAREFPDLEVWTIPAHVSALWRELRPLRRRAAPLWATERFEHLVCLRHARSSYRDVSLGWIRAEHWHGLGPRPTAATISPFNRPEPAPGLPATVEPPWSRELAAHRRVVGETIGRDVDWPSIRPRLKPPANLATDIVVCPFGGEPIRDYPATSWIAAMKAAGLERASLHLVGSADRASDLGEFATALRHIGATVRVTTAAPAEEFVELVGGARLVLTVESAAAHLATALNRPAVIVLGGGHFGWFAPWEQSPRQRWVANAVDCYGCNWVCRRPTVECIDGITPAALAHAIKEVLAHA